MHAKLVMSGVLPAIHSFEAQLQRAPSDQLQAVFPAVLDILDAMACVCLIWPLMCWRRRVDLGMLLALLAAVSRASCEERLAAAYKLLLWQAGMPLLPRPLAVAYVRLLKVCAPLLGRTSLCLTLTHKAEPRLAARRLLLW